MHHFLAFDLGASSGRAILGTLVDGRIELSETHRFDNGPVEVAGSLHWNLLGLFAEMKTGLRRTLERGVRLSGLGIDTWGVDYALLDRNGSLVGFPYHYRDRRTTDILPYAFARLPRQRLYQCTGIQIMTLNTVFQLLSMVRDRAPALDIAETLLLMPDALTYLFCGAKAAEYTIASTSQALDPAGTDWAWEVIDAFGIPRRIFPPVAQPCTVAGALLPSLCAELGCEPIPVLRVGSHDTAAAVAAVPARPDSVWAYLSSGTWSLLGVELERPLISEATLQANFTNEGGVGGTIRLLKNIMGLWLIQESRAEWARHGQTYGFGELCDLAAAAPPFRALVNPDDPRFLAPGNMPARLAEFCRQTGQPEPTTPGEVTRCALESLALRYRQVLHEADRVTGRRTEVLHLVGGGSQNQLLNQFTADALGCRVVTGPVEATALGNVVCQAMAVGAVHGLADAREVIRRSVDTREYTPRDAARWTEMAARAEALWS